MPMAGKNNCLLSLSLIMRDAAGEIESCLDSVAEAVDEMVIVDTGSRDDSVGIVRKFLRKWQQGHPGRQGKIYQVKWQDDFSAAKNYALSRCHGQWVLLLDSDERISAATGAHLRPLVQALSQGEIPEGIKAVRLSDTDEGRAEGGFDLLELWRENVDLAGQPVPEGDHWDLAVRLCHRHELLKYRGEVHEQLLYRDGRPLRSGAVDRSLLSIIHTGYRPGLKKEKEERNFRILLKEKERGGGTVLLDFYLAENFMLRREWKQALSHALASYNGVRPAHDKIAPLRIMYQSLRGLEQEALQRAGLQLGEGEPLPEPGPEESPALQEVRRLRQEEERVIGEAMGEFPEYPEFYYFRGGRRWNAGDKEGGLRDLQRSLELYEAFPLRFPEEELPFAELLPELKTALKQVQEELGTS